MALTNKKAWKSLRKHAVKTGNLHMSELFDDEGKRFKAFSRRSGNLLLDYSKQRVIPKTIELLCSLARECDLSSWIEKLFSGDAINTSENRPALHTALRLPSNSELSLDGNNIVSGIHETLERMEQIVKPYTCGGSGAVTPACQSQPLLTSVLAVPISALSWRARHLLTGNSPPQPTLTFFSSRRWTVASWSITWASRDPATTLFIISSKSFTTVDTLSNANTALQWLRQASGAEDEVLFRRHFIGISADGDKMADWGIPPNSRLHLWDWVGGTILDVVVDRFAHRT